MLALPRADAAERWRVSQRGAPSSRAAERLLTKWASRWMAGAYELLVELAADEGVRPGQVVLPSTAERIARRLAARLPEHQAGLVPPSAAELANVGRPSVRAAVRSAHRELVAVGMPRDYLVRRLGGLLPAPAFSTVRADSSGWPGGARADEAEKKLVADIIGEMGQPGARAVGIDLLVAGPGERVLLEWAEEGRSLIRTLAARSTADLPRRVVDAAASGGRWEDLVESIQQMGAKTVSHARLIAQDQVAKVNSKVTQDLQTAAGVDKYHWDDSDDERVRDTHREAAEMDIGYGPGVFTWADGAPNVGFYGESGHPGQAGRCRCRARPFVPQATRDAWAAAA